jgi:hypothetical protein
MGLENKVMDVSLRRGIGKKSDAPPHLRKDTEVTEKRLKAAASYSDKLHLQRIRV